MKSLKFQIILVSGLLLCILTTLVWLSVRRSFEDRALAEEYVLKNKIADHLNAATGWQAIERGYGATILGGGKGKSSPLFSNFLEMIAKGDSEVSQAKEHIMNLISAKSNETFEELFNKWNIIYEDLVTARHKIANNDISKEEWIYTATLNINCEFDLRNIAFAIQQMVEKVLYLNNVLRPNIIKLCEYAGLERALVGNAIASGEPISNETQKDIKHYRSIVEQSLYQVLLLKKLPSTSNRMKHAIAEFEEEFLGSFQLLREEVFESSKRQVDAITTSLVQIAERKTVFQDYLSVISSDLLNMSNHDSVKALAEALKTEYDAYLSERLSAVENLFKGFSQVRRTFKQIRYLDNSGHERARVDFDGNTTRIISGTHLQDKSERYYFTETINLSPGEVFISPLDLNIEHGKIEIPYQPVIRFATPVFVDGEQAGIIVQNLLVKTPLILHKGSEKEDYILADQDGFYIHHPDETREWGMMEMLNRSHHNIKQDYPDVAEQILSGKKGNVRLISGEMLFYEPFFSKTDTDASEFWVIIKQVKPMKYPIDASTWFDSATKAINSGLTISNIAGEKVNDVILEMKSAAIRNVQVNIFLFASSILIFFVFIFWSMNRILKPIQKLTLITQKIAGGDFSFKAEVKSRDEIGLLSASFNKMADDLQESNRVLRESEEKFRSISASANDAIIMADNDGKVVFWNNEAERMFDYLSKEVVGRNLYELVVPVELRERFLKGFKRFQDSGQGPLVGMTVELAAIKKDGTEFPIEHSISAVKINGKWNAIGIIRDITERKRMEETLLQSEKLKSIGTITSGVAHEFNNILAIISGNVQLLEGTYKDHEELTNALSIIKRATNDGAEISKRMLRFAKTKKDTIGFVSYEIRDLIEQAADFTMPRWKNMAQAKGINYHIDRDDMKEIPAILCNPTELREVFINIINNALDAMPDGGRISFNTWSREDTVFISISDKGEGMSETVRKNVFDPFFTTKIAVGTGLGMSTAYGIITEHGGKIEVESKIGKGTTFTLQFPAATKTVSPMIFPEPGQDTKSKSLRILVVDDEKDICTLLDKFLSKDGHKVRTVDNGAEAIELAKSEDFSLVLCDMAMPDVFGYDVIKALNNLEKRPMIGIITGWGEKLKPVDGEDFKVEFIIKKPFDLSELSRYINNLTTSM